MTSLSQRVWWRRPPVLVPRTRRAERVQAEAARPSSPVPFWALMSFTFCLLLAPQNLVPVLGLIRPAFLAGAFAIAAHVYDRICRAQSITILSPEIRLAGYLFGWALLTIPVSYWPGGSVEMILDLYAKTLAVFLLISNTVNSVARLRRVAWGLTLMAVPIAFTGVENFLSGVYVMGGGNQAVKRILGYEAPLTGNPNDLALILNLILPLTLALALITRRAMLRTALLLVVGLEIVAVLLTASRAGFLCLAAIGGLYVWSLRRRPERTWAYAALIGVLACLPLLPGAYISRLGTITNIEADSSGSAQQRYTQQVMAVRYVLAHPIVGAGVGMDGLAMREQYGSWQNIHNVYLQYAVGLGLPGLVLFLLLLRGTMRSAGSVQRRAAEVPELRELFHLATGIRTSLLAFAIAAFFSPVAYHFYFYYIAGLAVAVKAVDEASARAPEPPSGR
jgi:putative inorganic carbon (HCO3(-)) transporter